MKSSRQTRPTAMSLLWLLLFGVISIRLPNGHAWISSPPPFRSPFASRTSPATTELHDASEGAEGDQHPKQHVSSSSSSSMAHYHQFQEQVRTLQHSFYQSTPASCLDPSTGRVSNLPVWNVPWTEMPGRSHILQVDEPLYTGLFSSILARGNTKDQPWYFGSLYQAQNTTTSSSSSSGSKVLSQPPDPHQTIGALKLEAWQDSKQQHDSTTTTTPVLGTLMRIADYRRLQDGRLFLLVEAMERFVVTHVQQELPYGIATVQLIPDAEEVDPDDWIASSPEDQIGEARSGALAESFQRFHRYEYDETFRLPPPNDYVKHNSQFLRSLLTLVVPYVPLSKTVDLEALKDVPLDMTKPAASVEDSDKQKGLSPQQQQQQQPCLEQQLLQDNILKDYRHPDVSVQQMSLDDLEYRLWMEVNHFLKATKTPVSPVLLGLIPLSHHPSTAVGVGAGGDNIDNRLEEKDGSKECSKECSKEEQEERQNDPNNNIQWPSNFSLRKIADEIAKSDYKHNFVQVSPALPQYRRLRKLSYSLTAVLEENNNNNNTTSGNFRQELLEIVSTRARLERILERLESQNSDTVWGEFE